MRITLSDTRTLAVALVQAANDKFLNWNTGNWEAAPFCPANHAKALTPMEPPPSIFGSIQTADIGGELLSRPDAEAIVFAVSGSGSSATYTPIDLWTMPIAPYNCAGGMSRL
jgi:hypothetical protein